MVTLKIVDEGNFRKVIGMKLPDNNFVAPNVISLAQAWLYYKIARPFAICNDEEVIGFLMLSWDEEKRVAGIWRLMIALEQQGKGYGTEALKRAVDMIRSEGKFDYVELSYVPGNDAAKHIYEKLGFKETGEIDDGEVVMKLDLPWAAMGDSNE